jgi:hypothetical protein
MTTQIDLSSGRQIAIDTTTNAAAPTDGATAPTIILGPQSTTGLKTTGILMWLRQPGSGGAVPTAGGFDVTLWVQNPATGSWASGDTTTIDYRQAFDTFEFDAIPLYFQIGASSVGTPGTIWLEVLEQ